MSGTSYGRIEAGKIYILIYIYILHTDTAKQRDRQRDRQRDKQRVILWRRDHDVVHRDTKNPELLQLLAPVRDSAKSFSRELICCRPAVSFFQKRSDFVTNREGFKDGDSWFTIVFFWNT